MYKWHAAEENQQTQPLLSGEYGSSHSHDPQFKGTKESGRKCNDIIFAILFLVAIGGMIFISIIGFHKGHPEQLIPSNEWSGQVERKGEYWFQDSVAHLKRDWYILAGAVGFTFILAVVWIQLMKYFTKVFIYLTMFLGVIAVIAVGVYLLSLGFSKHNQGLKIASYCVFGVAAILIVIIFFLRKKIAFTAALFTETCKGVNHNPGVIFVGLIVFAALAVFTAYWVCQFIYLYSIPTETVKIDPNEPPKFDQKVRNLMYFQVFAFFWVTAFLSAVLEVSVAGALATWYFSRDLDGYRANVGSPAFRSFGRALSFHFGSVALGSLLLAVIQFINFMLRVTKKANQKNKVVVFIISCVQCLLSCIQRIVKFVDRFAYVYIAMHGDSFCTSAKNVFNLISRNMFTAVVVDFLGDFVLFVGKLLGTALAVFLTIVTLEQLHRPISPVTIAVIGVVSFKIFSLFASIVSVGVDTVMVCYLEDLERNKNGSLYMSPDLHKMLQEKVSNAKPINA
jgi:hypothetical protein